ncbi:MAG: hypothetical protein PHO02_00880 [Candidatus Nanoarchaeia archaeon]|nr:hypothetical protein [Candidatus Nanoarchaeia archaeon]
MVAKKKKAVLKKIIKKKPFAKKPAKKSLARKFYAKKSKKAVKFGNKIPALKLGLEIPTSEMDDLIVNLAGEDILPLVNLLRGRENVSEFAIAEKLNVTVNQVRNMLYRLHKSNLVTFTRKKDKKKGWYIYYWTLAIKNIKEALFMQKKRQLADFQERIAKESFGKFYVCPGKCARMTMEDAMEADFHCPECGQLMTEQDNKRTVENLQRRIDEISAEIKIEEDLRAAETARLIAKAKKSAARKPAKKAKKVVKKAAVKPVKKAVPKKAVKKVVKKIVRKPVKKTAPNIIKKAVKKAVKKVIVKKPLTQKKTEKKSFFGKLFAKKKKK